MKHFYLIICCGISMLALFSGCSKKSQEAASQAPTQPSNADTPSAATPSGQADPANALAAADAALKAKQYDEAVANLLKFGQQKGLTEQQLQAARDRMVRLQRDLTSAIAAGDPKAKAAGEMLRAASTPR